MMIAASLLITPLMTCCQNPKPDISIITDKNPGAPSLHGVASVMTALKSRGFRVEQLNSLADAKGQIILVTGRSQGNDEAAKILKAENHKIPETAEALTVWKSTLQNKQALVACGFDDTGVMYALLDIADRIGWSTDKKDPFSEVLPVTEKPDVRERAVSMYTMNRRYWESRFYDEKFWNRYLDMLANDRFNSLVVIFGYENGGFMAPCYPYFFDVEGFPDVKMVGLTSEEQKHNLETFNKLIKMAHDRGIRITAGIKDHIYRGGVQGGGIPGTQSAPAKPVPGLVWGLDAGNLIDYTKPALAKFIKLVPGLDGMLFFINDETGLKREELLGFATDFFKMIKEKRPDLKLYLHSKGLTDPMIQSAVNVGIDFNISPKYWMEQMGMPFHPTHINRENQMDRRHQYSNLLVYPKQYNIQWRMWNGGTTRILLWGDPEYARRFAQSSHLYDGNGFDVNEPLATKMEAQPHDEKPFDLLKPEYRYYDYEFERYWHFYQVFGRMGYNPETQSDIWNKEFEKRFGKKAGPLIETALHKASWILPRIVASTYPYGCFPTTRGWPEKQRLGDLQDYAKAEGSDIQQFASFKEEARVIVEGYETAKILPSVTKVWLEETSKEILKIAGEAENAAEDPSNKELKSTLTDLRILSGLAEYHAKRIPAAVSYNIFLLTQNPTALDDAIAFEKDAIEAWKGIIDAAGNVYADNLKMGVAEAEHNGMMHRLSGHWRDELALLVKDLSGLEGKRKDFKTGDNVKPVPPAYKARFVSAENPTFDFIHTPVLSAPFAKPLKIKVKVQTASGIKWVHIRYRDVNQEEDYKTLEMTSTGEKDTFEAVVPSEAVNSKWDFMYFIEAMDNKGHGKIYPDLIKETPYYIVNLIR